MVNHKNIITFYKEGNSLASCGREFNCTPQKIKTVLKQNNIPIRSRSEQVKIENTKRGYSINHNYFDQLNYISTYYLGFIAADGTVRKDRNAIKITLQAADISWLIDFKEAIQSEAPIRQYLMQEKYPVAELVFSSRHIKEQLAKYSIVPNKTYKNLTMENIPKEYRLSFIKGFYDGDGTFSANRVKIVSKTNGLFKEIQENTVYPWYLYYTSRDLYSLELSTLPSLDFLKDVYNIDTPKLERKYNKYLSVLNSRI